MPTPYTPSDYWEKRLQKSFNLRGVGHLNFSEGYNAWLYRRKDRCISALLRDLPLQGVKVLDVGCGTGFFVDWYTKRGADLTGVDITTVSVERLAARYPRGTFLTRDISSAAFEAPGPFAIVNMWDVMYHIVEPDAFDRALANIARILQPGGRFLTTDWFAGPADVRVADHVRARTLATYASRFGPLGLELESLTPLYGLLNRRVLGGTLDNRLGPLYYAIDGLARTPSPRNLSLALWRKRA